MSKAKPIFTLSLSLSLSLCLVPLLINLIFPLSSFAQTEEEEETLTIATYYPAPYGIYNEMRAKKMAVGDNYYSGSAYPWDTGGGCAGNEICNADLVVEGNIGIGTVSPQAKLDVAGNVNVAGKIKVGDDSVSPTAGTIRWTGSDLEVYDGSVWKSLTSGDTTIITSDVTDCNNFGGNWVDSQGVCYFPAAGECPSGWTQKESYSSTQGNTCAGKSCLGTYGNDIYGTSCSTGSHFRTNKDKEDCAYMSINEFEAQYGNCFPNNIECLATQTEVGCVKTE